MCVKPRVVPNATQTRVLSGSMSRRCTEPNSTTINVIKGVIVTNQVQGQARSTQGTQNRYIYIYIYINMYVCIHVCMLDTITVINNIVSVQISSEDKKRVHVYILLCTCIQKIIKGKLGFGTKVHML